MDSNSIKSPGNLSLLISLLLLVAVALVLCYRYAGGPCRILRSNYAGWCCGGNRRSPNWENEAQGSDERMHASRRGPVADEENQIEVSSGRMHRSGNRTAANTPDQLRRSSEPRQRGRNQPVSDQENRIQESHELHSLRRPRHADMTDEIRSSSDSSFTAPIWPVVLPRPRDRHGNVHTQPGPMPTIDESESCTNTHQEGHPYNHLPGRRSPRKQDWRQNQSSYSPKPDRKAEPS